MTTEERLDRIEHVTAALAEERRKDREDYRQLWRDTQRQITETNRSVANLSLTVANLADQLRDSDERAKAAEQELRERVTTLVSAIGELLPRPPKA